MASLMSMLKGCVPDRVKTAVRSWSYERRYRGKYDSWATARAAASGYEADAILHKAVEATRAVRDGHAVWERDTVLFYQPACHKPLLEALRIVSAEEGELDVLDFGGALGSTWWQHRGWLTQPAPARWSIVEQEGFVEAGRREFEVGPLRFYSTVDACLSQGVPNVVLLSSVLPYMKEPHRLLADLEACDCRWMIIDRTGFVKGGDDWLTVQHVPPSIYQASYPCWFFNRERLLAPLAGKWKVVSEWQTFDAAGKDFDFRGLMLKRIVPFSGSGGGQ